GSTRRSPTSAPSWASNPRNATERAVTIRLTPLDERRRYRPRDHQHGGGLRENGARPRHRGRARAAPPPERGELPPQRAGPGRRRGEIAPRGRRQEHDLERQAPHRAVVALRGAHEGAPAFSVRDARRPRAGPA